MKEKLFYFPFYPAQWLSDCNVLSLEEKGAYITLISTMYLQEDCSLFKRHLQNILGIQDKRRFDRIMDNIYPLLLDRGDKVTQKKVLEVRKQTEERSNKARNSAKARWNKPQTYKPKVYNKPKVVQSGLIPTLTAAQRARKILNDGHE